MSIASELTTLALNKAEIKAALENQIGTTISDALDDWSDTINQSIRKHNRISVNVDLLPKQESFTPDSGKTAFVIHVNDTEPRGLKFTIGKVNRRGSSSTITIDWGDNTSTTTTDTTDDGTQSSQLTHTYSCTGYYMIQISDDITRWRPQLNSTDTDHFESGDCSRPFNTWSQTTSDGQNAGYWSVANIKKIVYALQWGDHITDAGWTYNGCTSLIGNVPSWNNSITNAESTYRFCSGLTGHIPVWNSTITNAKRTFDECSGLTGSIPTWGVKIESAYHTYNNCTGLSGSIPTWGSKVTNTQGTYYGCTGLSGTIPNWNEIITNAQETYYGCTGLSGSVPMWNSTITNAQGTYRECSNLTGTIPSWLQTAVTNCNETYYGCTRLSGVIPVWSTNIINANYTYRYCVGLTGYIYDEPTDNELMPSTITSHSSTVNNTSTELRSLFLSTWGGTRSS